MKEKNQLDRDALELVAAMFKIFSDASRLEILQALKDGPSNVSELVDQLGMTQANVSKHLRIMYEAKIVSRKKEGTAVFYAISDDFVFPLCEMVCQKLNDDHQSQAELEFAI